MRINSFRITNFKCFRDSGELKFSPGFNLIVGQNNSGKTSLIKSLQGKIHGVPHASLKSKTTSSSRLDPLSEADVSVGISGSELRELMLNHPGEYWVPVPSASAESPLNRKTFLEDMFAAADIELSFKLACTFENASDVVQNPKVYPALGKYAADYDHTHGRMLLVKVHKDRANYEIGKEQRHQKTMEFGIAIAQFILKRIYFFEAQRFNLGHSDFGANKELNPNAANLAEVLGQLQGTNPARYRRFNSLVKQVLPSIQSVTIRADQRQRGHQEILVWMIDPETEREDLAITLTESGTGVGQVLAILYVVVMSDFPRTIIIDEPNSFLHPGAARKLMGILQDHPEHQYILATHAPEIISSSNAKSVTLLTWDAGESVAHQMNALEVKSMREVLLEVGARLSDVFGADAVIWVEGSTEEEAFPLILKHGGAKKAGLVFRSVRTTGKFISKKRGVIEEIMDIYKRLSQSNALIPPALAFVFDREHISTSDINDVLRRPGKAVRFINRNMYENYLIFPDALVTVMVEDPGFSDEAPDEAEIEEWLLANGGLEKYNDQTVELRSLSDVSWLNKVHGARLLEDLFLEFSAGRNEYIKIKHSVALTKYICEQWPERLDEVRELLNEIINGSPNLSEEL